MHVPAILSLAALAAAVPAATLDKRACKIAYPEQHFQLISTEPEHNTGNHDIVVTGFSGATEYITELHFAGFPAGSYGCRLQLFFPADGSGRLETNPTNHKLNFYTVQNPPVDVETDTWDDNAGKGYLVGTVDVVRNDPNVDTVLEVANSGCPAEGLDYRVEIEKNGGQTEGNVQFWQENGAGLRMLYDC